MPTAAPPTGEGGSRNSPKDRQGEVWKLEGFGVTTKVCITFIVIATAEYLLIP